MTSQTTFLETVLGKDYKWWYVVKYFYKVDGKYFVNNLLHFLGQTVSIYSAVLIWNYTNSSAEIISNLILGVILFVITTNSIYWSLGGSIEHGSIAKSLILPISLLTYNFFITTGFTLRIFIYYAIILCPLFFIIPDKLVLNFAPLNIFLLLLLVVVAILIRYFIAFILGLTSFWTVTIYGQSNLYENMMPLILGVIFPYNLITVDWLRTSLQLSPWSFIVYHPMQVYLGKYTWLETLYVFLGGIFWCVILYLLSKLILKLGLKRNESVGL